LRSAKLQHMRLLSCLKSLVTIVWLAFICISIVSSQAVQEELESCDENCTFCGSNDEWKWHYDLSKYYAAFNSSVSALETIPCGPHSNLTYNLSRNCNKPFDHPVAYCFCLNDGQIEQCGPIGFAPKKDQWIINPGVAAVNLTGGTCWMSSEGKDFHISIIFGCPGIFSIPGISEDSTENLLPAPDVAAYCGNFSSACHRCFQVTDDRFCQNISIFIFAEYSYVYNQLLITSDILNLPISFLTSITVWIDDSPYLTFPTSRTQYLVPVEWNESRSYRIFLTGTPKLRPEVINSNLVNVNFSVSRQKITNESPFIVGMATLILICLSSGACCLRMLCRKCRSKRNNRFQQFNADIPLDTVD